MELEDARGIAAQCWCDPETEHIVMDTNLAEAFAKRLMRYAPYEAIRSEREYQKSRGWKDECNNSFAWVAYIVNYVSRFAMPVSFDTTRYSFRACMVKAAALCVAAIEWYDANQPTDNVDLPKSVTP